MQIIFASILLYSDCLKYGTYSIEKQQQSNFLELKIQVYMLKSYSTLDLNSLVLKRRYPTYEHMYTLLNI